MRLLVLGAGPAQLGVLAAARRRGLTVVAADRDPSAPGFRHADRRAIVSIEDEPAIDRLARAEEIDGVVAPGSDHAVGTAARIAARLALPHPVSPETAMLAISKLRQREALAAAGIPQPRSRVCRSLPEVTEAAEELGYPVVVEAPDRSGERGVALARDREQLAAAAAAALADSRGEYCLVEELVGGRIVTVNGWLSDGRFLPLTVTDREQAPPPAFGVPLAHLWPAALEPARIGAAVEIVSAAVAALGIRNGPATTQLLFGDLGPLVAKVSARVGGGHDAELCRVALGVDANDLAVGAALGEQVLPSDLIPGARVGGAVVRFLVAPPGELRRIRGVEAAYALAGVRGIRIYRGPGHVFHELRRASDRAGAILATGDSREEALAAADEAAALIRFVAAPLEAVA
ncbi:MAG: ATP-grasp domain-containing protein [Gaiellaceae bacterium]